MKGYVVWIGAGVLAVAAAAVWSARHPPAADESSRCKPEPSPYTKARRHALAARFGELGPRFAAEIWPRIDGALQQRSQTYGAVWREVCKAADDDPVGLTSQRDCLRSAAASLDAQLSKLEVAEAEAAERMLLAAMRLPDPQRCLEADEPSDVDLERREATVAILDEATAALERAEYDVARERAAAAQAEAKALGSEALLDDATILHAEALWRLGKVEQAEQEAHRVALDSAAADRHRTSAAAATLLIRITGADPTRFEEAERWNERAAASIEHMGGDSYADAERMEAMGQALLNAARYDEAVVSLKRARRAFAGVFGPGSPHVARVDLALSAAEKLDHTTDAEP